MLVESAHGLAPRPVIVIRISIGTFEWVRPVAGLVQLVSPAQVAVVPEIPLNGMECRVPSRPARGGAIELGPQ